MTLPWHLSFPILLIICYSSFSTGNLIHVTDPCLEQYPDLKHLKLGIEFVTHSNPAVSSAPLIYFYLTGPSDLLLFRATKKDQDLFSPQCPFLFKTVNGTKMLVMNESSIYVYVDGRTEFCSTLDELSRDYTPTRLMSEAYLLRSNKSTLDLQEDLLPKRYGILKENLFAFGSDNSPWAICLWTNKEFARKYGCRGRTDSLVALNPPDSVEQMKRVILLPFGQCNSSIVLVRQCLNRSTSSSLKTGWETLCTYLFNYTCPKVPPYVHDRQLEKKFLSGQNFQQRCDDNYQIHITAKESNSDLNSSETEPSPFSSKITRWSYSYTPAVYCIAFPDAFNVQGYFVLNVSYEAFTSTSSMHYDLNIQLWARTQLAEYSTQQSIFSLPLTLSLPLPRNTLSSTTNMSNGSFLPLEFIIPSIIIIGVLAVCFIVTVCGLVIYFNRNRFQNCFKRKKQSQNSEDAVVPEQFMMANSPSLSTDVETLLAPISTNSSASNPPLDCKSYDTCEGFISSTSKSASSINVNNNASANGKMPSIPIDDLSDKDTTHNYQAMT